MSDQTAVTMFQQGQHWKGSLSPSSNYPEKVYRILMHDEQDIIADEQTSAGKWPLEGRLKNCYYYRFRKKVFHQIMQYQLHSPLPSSLIENHFLNLPLRFARTKNWNWTDCVKFKDDELLSKIARNGIDLNSQFKSESITLLANNKRGSYTEVDLVKPDQKNCISLRKLFLVMFDFFRKNNYIGQNGCCFIRSGIRKGSPTFIAEGYLELNYECFEPPN